MRGPMKLEENEITLNGWFKYLTPIFQSSGDIQQDVTHRIKCGLQNEKRLLNILWRGVPLKVKGQVLLKDHWTDTIWIKMLLLEFKKGTW